MKQLPKGVSQRDIATNLGISISTVSRALKENSRVSQLTRDAVQNAIEELTAASSDRQSITAPLMIGVTHSHTTYGLRDNHSESVLDQVLGGVEVACRKYDAVPYPWQQSHLLPKPESGMFFSRVSGVIVSGGEIDDDVVDAILERGMPIVIAGGHAVGGTIASVGSDNAHGLYLATSHLIELGHRRIGFVNGPNTTHTSREKKSGYLTALFDCGLPVDPALLVARDDSSGLSYEAAEELTYQLLDLESPPTALIYATDEMAVAGNHACQSRGLRIPNDISLVGFHDDNAALGFPPMTTIKVNRFDWGVTAVEMLLRTIRGESTVGSRTLLPVELIVRESTAPPRSGDSHMRSNT